MRIKSRKLLLFLIDTAIYIGVWAVILTVVALTYASNGEEVSAQYVRDSSLEFLVTYALVVLSRLAFRVYNNVWRYADSQVFLQMVAADAVGCALGVAVLCVIPLPTGFNLWFAVALVVLSGGATLCSRFVYQQYYRRENTHTQQKRNKVGVAIVGAGQIGTLLADELVLNASSHYYPVCFVDTAPSKIGSRIRGIRVYSEEEFLNSVALLPIQEIFIALAEADRAKAERVFGIYSRTGCKVKTYDFPMRDARVTGVSRESGRVIRDFNIEDLLFRGALQINDTLTREFYTGKTVLVTGGGGSIGSELCRQIAGRAPKQLIIFDIYENNAYEIQQELFRKYGDNLNLQVEIGSVRDRARLEAVFSKYRPQVVFHAAAHKHVPLMEHSSGEAIKNNVFGTYNTADMAEKYGVEKFVLISTDKAVNPTNIMGASKRLCEMVIQCRGESRTVFAAVRFGNVLGSNGSVIPLFKKQIEAGGPVTITDKRIIRYFMTISEASQLVIQAGEMAKKGELFVLDMGNPVKILDLAENMIRLSGFRPYDEINIVEVGLRPGEKLYEELLLKTEHLDKTDNDMIFVEQDTPLSRDDVDKKLQILRNALAESHNESDSEAIRVAMHQVVPTYCDPEAVNCHAAQAEEMILVNAAAEKSPV